MARPGVMLYFSILPLIQALSLEDRGLLFTDIMKYGKTGEEPCYEGSLKVAWAMIKPMLDQDSERYAEICRKRSNAVSERWKKENTNVYNSKEEYSKESDSIQMNTTDTNSNCNINSSYYKQHKNKVPASEDILAFGRENGIPESFLDSILERYSSSGWKDQHGNQIRDIRKFILRAWEDERSENKSEADGTVELIRRRQREEAGRSCTTSDLIEFPYGSGRYMPKAEVEAMNAG